MWAWFNGGNALRMEWRLPWWEFQPVRSSFSPRLTACPSWCPRLHISDLPDQPPLLHKPTSCNKCLNIELLLVLLPREGGGLMDARPQQPDDMQMFSNHKKLTANENLSPAELVMYWKLTSQNFFISWFLKSVWNSHIYIQYLKGEKGIWFQYIFQMITASYEIALLMAELGKFQASAIHFPGWTTSSDEQLRDCSVGKLQY